MGEKHSGGHDGVLSNRRRRLVLDQLQTHETMTLRDLAEQLAVADQGASIEALCEEAIQEIEVALHHVHAPKLKEAGYVEYDPRRRLVGVTETGRRLDVDTDGLDAGVGPKDGISVDLCPSTIDDLHDVIRNDGRFDARMMYDEVIGTVLADHAAEGSAEQAAANEPGDREEAR